MQSQVEILEIKSHTGFVLWKFLNLGLLLQAPSSIGFLWVQSRFHLQVTQINPIPYQKEASSQSPPKAYPDPDPFGLFTPPQCGSCCRVCTVFPSVGQQRMQSCAVFFFQKPWANKWERISVQKWICTAWACRWVRAWDAVMLFSSLGTWRQTQHLLPDVDCLIAAFRRNKYRHGLAGKSIWPHILYHPHLPQKIQKKKTKTHTHTHTGEKGKDCRRSWNRESTCREVQAKFRKTVHSSIL